MPIKLIRKYIKINVSSTLHKNNIQGFIDLKYLSLITCVNISKKVITILAVLGNVLPTGKNTFMNQSRIVSFVIIEIKLQNYCRKEKT